MKKSILITLTLSATLFSACTTCKNVASQETIYGDWQIETAMDKSTQNGDQPATISFGSDGRVNGCATVNSFFGDYKNNKGKLTFSTVGMTRMMGQSMDIERAICDALDKTSTIEVKGDRATIYDKQGKAIMELKKK